MGKKKVDQHQLAREKKKRIFKLIAGILTGVALALLVTWILYQAAF